MKKSLYYITIIIFLILVGTNSKTVAQTKTKQQIIDNIAKSLNKYYLADTHKITLNEDIITLSLVKFKQVDKFNLNTVKIELLQYENSTGTFQLNFKCVNGSDCIYSTKINYHNILGIPLSCTELEGNGLLNDFIKLQNIVQKESVKKNSPK